MAEEVMTSIFKLHFILTSQASLYAATPAWFKRHVAVDQISLTAVVQEVPRYALFTIQSRAGNLLTSAIQHPHSLHADAQKQPSYSQYFSQDLIFVEEPDCNAEIIWG